MRASKFTDAQKAFILKQAEEVRLYVPLDEDSVAGQPAEAAD